MKQSLSHIPILAIVGRPNVGKSTLFNRFIGRKQAIVYDQPGVTRDRNYAEADWAGYSFKIIDTGGYETLPQSDLFAQMRRQVEVAIREADVVLLVVDGRAEVTPDDEEMATKLRRAGKKTFLVVNKIDTANQELALSEFYTLGIQNLFAVSAEHGRGVGDLLDAVIVGDAEKQREAGDREQLTGSSKQEEPSPDAPIRLAILGRPNVGKSTLLNRLYGAPRAVVHSEPGTTRDPLEIEMEEEGRKFKIVDTAGIRKKSHSEGKIEKVSVMKGFEIIQKSDVALLLLDASVGMTSQDAKVAEQAVLRRRPLILLINKWDVASDEFSWAKVVELIDERYEFLKFVPKLKISAKTGLGLSRLFHEILKVYAEYEKRLTTGEVNRVFRDLTASHPPPGVSGKTINLFYMTQVSNRPPHFVIFCNHPKLIPKSYERYLVRGLRESFSFRGTPVVLEFRARKKKRFHG